MDHRINLVCTAARSVVGGLFLWAGLVKAGASEQFALTLAALGWVPEALQTPAALGLPLVEILFGGLILFPRTARIGAFGLGVLSATFAGVIGSALAQGMIVDCSCFGEGTPSEAKMLWTVCRDVALVIVCVWIYTTHSRHWPKNSSECPSARNP